MSGTAAWPPSNGVTSKIVPRENAVFQISYSTVVRAPAPLVFDTVLHAANYPAWNTWVPRAEILTQPSSPEGPQDGKASDDAARLRHRMTIGCTMRFTVVMNADKPDAVTLTPLKVVDICTPSSPTSYLTPEQLEDPAFTADLSKVYRVSWTGNGGMYAFGMKLERFHEVIVTGENECEVRTWEIMGGMLSRLVKVLYEDTLKGKVGLWCEDLKKYCEKVHNEAVTSGEA
ncbi:hypothetical protein GT037_011145 [Alternaria burnsii]|uniref:Polyketide cyclase/dehydrase n=1 Tax=Alternaria burnsii TaxID=1187904 RepID=A0A8H7AX83_9PLEO|nr:uncharacterized protein GT037_011145 [Alternaria burnsii]KAF7670694.1 hypothetical protein GT037_011145 [Alternaria burnsii]